jgi:hypothetical protein
LVLGTALAPTDPAVVFSALGHQEITRRAGVIIEGESGANDPVGIALLVSLLTAGSATGWTQLGTALGEFRPANADRRRRRNGLWGAKSRPAAVTWPYVHGLERS